jgi:hypothetical protein
VHPRFAELSRLTYLLFATFRLTEVVIFSDNQTSLKTISLGYVAEVRVFMPYLPGEFEAQGALYETHHCYHSADEA